MTREAMLRSATSYAAKDPSDVFLRLPDDVSMAFDDKVHGCSDGASQILRQIRRQFLFIKDPDPVVRIDQDIDCQIAPDEFPGLERYGVGDIEIIKPAIDADEIPDVERVRSVFPVQSVGDVAGQEFVPRDIIFATDDVLQHAESRPVLQQLTGVGLCISDEGMFDFTALLHAIVPFSPGTELTLIRINCK